MIISRIVIIPGIISRIVVVVVVVQFVVVTASLSGAHSEVGKGWIIPRDSISVSANLTEWRSGFSSDTVIPNQTR